MNITSTVGIHKVKSGDTLSEIAEKYGTSVEAIMRMNPFIQDRDLIFPDQMLSIPCSRDTDDELLSKQIAQLVETYYTEKMPGINGVRRELRLAHVSREVLKLLRGV